MIFLFILYNLFLYGNVLAVPLLPLHQTETLFNSCEINPDRFTQRSKWNIIWGCFATLFACSWVAIHPNIPAKSDSHMRRFLRRLMIMAYMLIVPEIVIYWAGRQWYAAWNIANKHKDQGWTRTHGFFALMGGFMLCDKNDKMIETLSIQRLENLASEGKIRWPSISEDDIEDRSKRDAFSKCLAVLQTTWFITQCIARGVYGLTVTELEVVTLAFAIQNGVLHFLWWNKPQDVACPVAVYLAGCHPSSNRETSGVQATNSECGEHDRPSIRENDLLSSPKETDESATPELQTSASAHFLNYCRRFCYLILLPIRMFLWPLRQMMGCDSLTGSTPLSVPTFYSPNINQVTGFETSYIAYLVGILFGGIHCIAWSFTFPSAEEKYIWRISAVTITAMPLAVAFTSVDHWIKSYDPQTVAESFQPRRCGNFLRGSIRTAMKILMKIWNTIVTMMLIVIMLSLPFYFLSRTALLILPLLALRSLSPGSFLDVNWSSFIPHIY